MDSAFSDFFMLAAEIVSNESELFVCCFLGYFKYRNTWETSI